MWVATEAEFDQRAVRMHAEGARLPAEAILKRYLPPVRSSWSSRIHTSVYILTVSPVQRLLAPIKDQGQ